MTTATLTRSYVIGPQQMPHTIPAGATVHILTRNETSELVYISHGRAAGTVRRTDLAPAKS